MDKCEHRHWRIFGDETRGLGTCLDCGKKVQVHHLLNADHDRLVLLEKRIERLLEDRL